MKAGTSKNQQEAQTLINELKPDIERYWKSKLRNLPELRTKYDGELIYVGLYDKNAYVRNSYVAAREYGCNIEEAQIFTTHYL